MKKKYIFAAVLLLAISIIDALFIGIYRMQSSKEAQADIAVAASVYPLYLAAANIAKGCSGVSVTGLGGPQAGCLHDYVLTPEDMKLLAFADIFFVNGGGAEPFLSDAASQNETLSIVETAGGGDSGTNSHAWMSISDYLAQVSVMEETLCQFVPEYREQFAENADAYRKKLLRLKEEQDEIKKAAAGSTVISLHEACSCLAEDYGLRIGYELDLDGERQMGAGEAAELLQAIEATDARIIFAEESYGRKLAETIQKEADVSVYYLDILTQGDGLDSYLDGMQQNIYLLKEAFGV